MLRSTSSQRPTVLRAGKARRIPNRPRAVVARAADRDVAVAVARVQVATEIRDGDDVELETLGRVDGHHPDPVVSLGLHRGHALALVAAGRLRGERQEAGEVAALVCLVVAGEAHQLAHVRHAPGATLAGDQAEVVAERGHRSLDQLLEGQERRLGPQPAEDAAEALQPLRVLGLDRLQPLVLMPGRFAFAAVTPRDQRPDVLGVPALGCGRAAQEPERVGADPVRERGQGAEQVLVVERVRDHAEQPDQVLHLLLGPVAATADHERPQAGAVSASS